MKKLFLFTLIVLSAVHILADEAHSIKTIPTVYASALPAPESNTDNNTDAHTTVNPEDKEAEDKDVRNLLLGMAFFFYVIPTFVCFVLLLLEGRKVAGISPRDRIERMSKASNKHYIMLALLGFNFVGILFLILVRMIYISLINRSLLACPSCGSAKYKLLPPDRLPEFLNEQEAKQHSLGSVAYKVKKCDNCFNFAVLAEPNPDFRYCSHCELISARIASNEIVVMPTKESYGKRKMNYVCTECHNTTTYEDLITGENRLTTTNTTRVSSLAANNYNMPSVNNSSYNGGSYNKESY